MGFEPERDQVTTVHNEELDIPVRPLSDDNATASTKLSAKVWPAGGLSGRWNTIASNEQTLINTGPHAHMAWTAVPDPPCNVVLARSRFRTCTWFGEHFGSEVALVYPTIGHVYDLAIGMFSEHHRIPHEPYTNSVLLQIPTYLVCRSDKVSFPFTSPLDFLPTILPFTSQYRTRRKEPG